MSVSATLTFTIHKYDVNVTWVDIIKFLLENGWTVNDCGKMTYLPLSDNNTFNWQHEEINEKKLFKILEEKEKSKESLGVSITWLDTNIGGNILTHNENEFSLIITINRQKIKLYERKTITDVNWYLLKLNSIMAKRKDVIITSIKFYELM
ncbi:MAG: hypothetical protein LBD23_17570 [Oscillospiraceae bacterium]|jgi:hypothetical protein|nr:hypothetical protein [Oscillospiraceae bacterium]